MELEREMKEAKKRRRRLVKNYYFSLFLSVNEWRKKGEQHDHNAKQNESHGIRIMHFCVACNDVFKWNVFALKKSSLWTFVNVPEK